MIKYELIFKKITIFTFIKNKKYKQIYILLFHFFLYLFYYSIVIKFLV